MLFHAPVYVAAGEVTVDQIINPPRLNVDQVLTEITEILAALQQNNPSATESEAANIIEAKFQEVKTQQPGKWHAFRQQLLNPEQWLNGGKAALRETAKHSVDNNVFYKAGLAFLDGFSADDNG